MSLQPSRPSLVVFASSPPPMHGSTLAIADFMALVAPRLADVTHVDTRYTAEISELGSITPRKLMRFFRYCGRLAALRLRGRAEVVLTAPAFRQGAGHRDCLTMIFVHVLLRTRLIIWVHTSELSGFIDSLSGPWRALLRIALRRASAAVVLGENGRATIGRYLSPGRVFVVPNRLRDDAPESLAAGVGDADCRILFLSNMLEAKGWRLLLSVAEELCTRHGRCQFDFYGAPTRDSTADEIHRSFAMACSVVGGSPRIRYHGSVDGAAKWSALAKSSVFVLPSQYRPETFPLSILEAMRSGLPVVATDVGEIAQVVRDGETGFVIAAGDRHGLVRALERLVVSPALRTDMGRHGRLRFREQYCSDAPSSIHDEWREVIAMAVHGPAARKGR